MIDKLAWELFASSGKISHYLFYRAVTEPEKSTIEPRSTQLVMKTDIVPQAQISPTLPVNPALVAQNPDSFDMTMYHLID